MILELVSLLIDISGDPKQFSGGIWVVAKLLQTKRRAQANLQKVSSKCPRNKETENVIKIDHQHYSFTSIGSESLPPAETDVATLKVVTDFVTSLARAATYEVITCGGPE